MSGATVRVGIDLGTTTSSIAFDDGSGPVIIEQENHVKLTPSVVAMLPGGKRLVGQPAVDQMQKNLRFTFSQVKRLIGQMYVDGEDRGPQVVENEGGEIGLQGPDGIYSPAKISGEIIQRLVASAEVELRTKIDAAVIGVPALFDERQRVATVKAGYLAGLAKVDLINEPVAAALAYGLGRSDYERVLAYDLGGGTFDVSCMTLGSGRNEVNSKNGNNFLGGADFDAKIVAKVSQRFLEKFGVDLHDRPWALIRLAVASEEAKRKLSVDKEARISLPYLAASDDPDAPRDISLDEVITVEDFDVWVDGLVKGSIEITKRALADAKWKPRDVDKLILIGGMTHVPIVRKAIEEFIGREAVQGVSPELAVALGAAIHGASLDNRLGSYNHQDRLAQSFGLRTMGGAFLPVLKKGDVFPLTKAITITSSRKGQGELEIGVYEGVAPRSADNRHIVTDAVQIEEGDVGSHAIELEYDVDASGLLSVVARNDEGEEMSIYSGATEGAKI